MRALDRRGRARRGGRGAAARTVLAVVVALVVIGPIHLLAVGLLGIAWFSTVDHCATAPSRGPGGIPEPTRFEPLVLHSADGEEVPMESGHLDYARRALDAAASAGADERGVLVLFMTILQESRFRMYANPGAVPESMQYPHDAEGSDHDSVGLLQQRPSAGWGEVRDLMDPYASTLAFFGGSNGPNGGSPAGLFDVEGWGAMGLGEAAQAVQVSAFPELYERWRAAAETLAAHLGGLAEPPGRDCSPPPPGGGLGGPAAYPFLEPVGISDDVGPRPCQVWGAGGCASSTWHPAIDFDAACGTPVHAVRGGVVTLASGYWVSITADDGAVASYLHMFESDVLVAAGDRVEAGQRIGAVGNAGPSTGCHLDLRVSTLTATDPTVLALPYVGVGEVEPGWIDPDAYLALFGVDLVPSR